MKFLVPNYSCLQNPWLGGCRPQIPVLSVLCPQLNLLNPPTPKKKSWVRHWFEPTVSVSDIETGSVNRSIIQQLVAGQCTEGKTVNKHLATQFLPHSRPLEVRHLWITWSSHSFHTFSSPGVFLLVSLTHVNSFRLSLLPLGCLRHAMYRTTVSSHLTPCLFWICKTMVCSFPCSGHETYCRENVKPKVGAIRLLLKYSWFSVRLRPLTAR